MPTYDASSASCLVYTFKDGLLSKVAHDLKLSCERFTLDVADDKSKLEATFQLSSLVVECARKDGRDAPGGLSDSDKRKIEKNMAADVLHTKRHAEARFVATEVTPDGEGFRVTGDLTLHGQTRPISARVDKRGDRFVTELALNQPDFGIKPFSAMLGTLKVKPEIRVELSVPAS
ncbi:MAG: YceI family protein [Deltaproteobacteria bacterium]|nr:YceI family protein [Deltaproteobacteria bacterium]